MQAPRQARTPTKAVRHNNEDMYLTVDPAFMRGGAGIVNTKQDVSRVNPLFMVRLPRVSCRRPYCDVTCHIVMSHALL